MHCVVTGGAGFIGSHLVDALRGEGHRVTVLDDLSTGSRHNLSTHLGQEGFRLVEGSVLDAEQVAQVLGGAELVFHLAAAVGVDKVVHTPVETIITNVQGTHTVLEACLVRRLPLLLTSTSEVYGKSERERFHEEDDLVLGATTRARWSYAASKAVDEYLALAYHARAGLPVFIVRLFNTVGPRQTGRYGMVLPRLVGQALAGEPLTVYGDGQQTRCFVHVQDVVPALVTLGSRPALAGQVVNLGSDHEVSIGELAARVLRVTGSSSRVVHIPYEEAHALGFEDMRRRRPDLERARRLLGFAPVTGIDTIIADVAAHLRAQPPPASP